MANLRTQKRKDRRKIAKIEKKYDKLINDTIQANLNKPMSELCDELDVLKSKMHTELLNAGVLVEN